MFEWEEETKHEHACIHTMLISGCEGRGGCKCRCVFFTICATLKISFLVDVAPYFRTWPTGFCTSLALPLFGGGEGIYNIYGS